jgi:hypothetical protein
MGVWGIILGAVAAAILYYGGDVLAALSKLNVPSFLQGAMKGVANWFKANPGASKWIGGIFSIAGGVGSLVQISADLLNLATAALAVSTIYLIQSRLPDRAWNFNTIGATGLAAKAVVLTMNLFKSSEDTAGSFLLPGLPGGYTGLLLSVINPPSVDDMINWIDQTTEEEQAINTNPGPWHITLPGYP